MGYRFTGMRPHKTVDMLGVGVWLAGAGGGDAAGLAGGGGGG